MDDTYATLPGSTMPMGYGYSSGGAMMGATAVQPVSATMVSGGAPALPAGAPPGARYAGSSRAPDGGIVDRYIVPQRATVPVRQVVPEVQQFMTSKQVMVPEVHEVQVPQQRMVPQQHTVMVPRTKMVPVQEMVPQTVTRMVPQTYTTTQQVTRQKAVTVQQPMQRTIQKVIEGQKIVEASRVIEYERPRVIPGRFVGQQQTEAREVGLQWNKQYYSGMSPPMPAGPSRQIIQQQQPASISYVQAAPQTVSYVQQAPMATSAVPVTGYSAAPVTSYVGGYSGGYAQYGGASYAGGVANYDDAYEYEQGGYSQYEPSGTVI